MSSSPERTAQLERDLRAAVRAFDDVPVAGDAWQQNQQRLAADHGRRGRALLAIAAGLVLVLAVGALLLGGGNGGKRTLPGGGGDDPFGDSVVLGPPVDVETVTIDGVETTHQAVLSDQTGKGPNLCDRYGTDSGANGSCTSRDPSADDPEVAFDWLTGTVGGGDIRGVLAGVDSRVMKVQIWMDNGDMTLADLKPGGWEDTKLFALTVPADGPRPQRLAAYSDAPGTVLQALDLTDVFGTGWLPGVTKHCEGAFAASGRPTGNAGGVDVELWNGSAKVIMTGSDTIATECIGLQRPLQGVIFGSRDVVVVIAPEITMITVLDPAGGMAAWSVTPAPLPGSLWKVAALHIDQEVPSSAVVLARDATDHDVQRVPISDLR